jgi:hypothetical protein
VAIVALLVLGWFFGYWRRRKNESNRNRNVPELAVGEQVYQYQYPAEPKPEYVAYSKPPAELGNNEQLAPERRNYRYEMGG